jgi:hypothetical protein
MDYEELKDIVNIGDIIQIAAPYVAGVGQLVKLMPKTMVVDPYIKAGYEEDSLPATTILELSDVHMIFILKPDLNDAKSSKNSTANTVRNTKGKVSKD